MIGTGVLFPLPHFHFHGAGCFDLKCSKNGFRNNIYVTALGSRNHVFGLVLENHFDIIECVVVINCPSSYKLEQSAA